MTDPESRLKEMRLAAPSPELDRRISAVLSAVADAAQEPRTPSRWWWLLVLTASGAAAAVILVGPWPRRAPPVPTEYRIEATGRLRQMLLEPRPSVTGPAPITVKGGDTLK
jgi:hypothetical protein